MANNHKESERGLVWNSQYVFVGVGVGISGVCLSVCVWSVCVCV